MCPYILLFMVFQITPLQVYRTNMTFPRSTRAKGKDPKQLPRKLELKQNQNCNNSYFYAVVWVFEVNHVYVQI